MSGTRRRAVGCGLATTATLVVKPAVAAAKPAFKVVAFDAFAIFNPGSVRSSAESLLPGQAQGLMTLWRTRQFEYTWLRAAADRYVDFEKVTDDALTYALCEMKVSLTAQQRSSLVGATSTMETWPDVVATLSALKAAGLRVVLMANLTPSMMRGCIAASGIENVFDHIFSTDAARTFKPDSRACQLGIDGLQLPGEDILFVPSAGWDAAGGRSFVYTTF